MNALQSLAASLAAGLARTTVAKTSPLPTSGVPAEEVTAEQVIKALSDAGTVVSNALAKAAEGKSDTAQLIVAVKSAAQSLGAFAALSKGSTSSVAKAELDSYTAMTVTMNAAQSRMWGCQDLLRAGKLQEAAAEAGGISEMLSSVLTLAGSSDAAPADAPPAEAAKNEGGDGVVSVKMTADQFLSWTQGQLAAAATEPTEKAEKRLAHLAKAIDIAKGLYFEAESTASANPLVGTMTMTSLYAPMGFGATSKDAPSGEQSESTSKLEQPAGTGAGATNFSSNAPDWNATGGSGKGGSSLPQGSSGPGATTFSSNPVEKKLNEIRAELGKALGEKPKRPAWPSDMNNARPWGLVSDAPVGVNKRDPELAWGKDPPAARGRR